MFKCLLSLTLKYDDSELDLERTVELPFPPYPGLFVESVAEAALDPQIETVFWIEEEASFRVVCHPLTVAGDREEAIRLARREGWGDVVETATR